MSSDRLTGISDATYDVVVIGGALSGAAIATLLLRHNPGLQVNNLVVGNTNLGWRLRLQVWAFYAICALQRRFPIVQRLNLSARQDTSMAVDLA